MVKQSTRKVAGPMFLHRTKLPDKAGVRQPKNHAIACPQMVSAVIGMNAALFVANMADFFRQCIRTKGTRNHLVADDVGRCAIDVQGVG